MEQKAAFAFFVKTLKPKTKIMETEINYPTLPDADGFYFENENEELLAITTKEYENGNLVKKVPLKKGRFAIVRELDQKEMKKVREIAGDGKDQQRFSASMIAMCTRIDDKDLIMEDVLEYKAKDFGRISMAAQALNF